MASKKSSKKTIKPVRPSKTASSSGSNDSKHHGEPKFPYTTEVPALGRLLKAIPNRPKPPKINLDTLKAWSVSARRDTSPIGVLKKLGLLESGGEPNDAYVEFMKTGTGPAVLGKRIREVYRVFFENAHNPQNESVEELKKLFNIHSGGGDDAMRLQVQTFKTLAEHATFDERVSTNDTSKGMSDKGSEYISGANTRMPPVQVDLHIHLPENKSSRDYESIIQDIARYIYGRNLDES